MPEYIVNSEEEHLFYGDKYEELIRCKDCKEWLPPQYGVCGLCTLRHDLIVKSRNGYCDEAKRKEE